jgi:hypothetical protein
MLLLTVCVSDLLISEIKRIIKSSEIMKYSSRRRLYGTEADCILGKMTRNGQRRTRTGDRNSRLKWAMTIFPLKYVGSLVY